MNRPLSLIWSALWRAEVTHLALFVVLPCAVLAARAVFGIALLPFLLVGASGRDASLTGEVRHLGEPACWVAVLPCSLADRALYEPDASPTPSTQPSTGVPGTEPEPFLPLPTSLTVRHAWFVLWLLWFVAHLFRHERARDIAGRP